MSGFRRALPSPAFGCAIVLSVLGLLLGASAHAESPPFTVNSTADTSDSNVGDGICADSAGACTLRAALEESDAPANPGKDTIAFDIPGPTPHTIVLEVGRLDSFDPAGVVIDGATEPDYQAGHPVVVIEHTGGGLVIHGAKSTVRGLVIHGGGPAIIFELGGNVVEGNFIGTDAAGMKAVPTGGGGGVFVVGGTGENRIGGTTPAARNVIVVNPLTNAVSLTGSWNIVQGNFLGTNAAGTEALGSGTVSVVGDRTTLGGTDGTTPGGPCTGACNLIVGGNVFVGDRTTSKHVVQGNFIGTDVNGTTGLGFGLLELDGNDNLLGGTEPEQRNVIAGGVAAGYSGFTVLIGGDGNRVEGNRIGTDVNGAGTDVNGESLQNGGGLVIFGNGNHVGGAAGTMPGGPCTGACNLISGKLLGVSMGFLSHGAGNFVQGNYIGTNPAGADLGNDGVGVAVGVSNNVIGGSAPGEGNVIAGNGGDGITDSGTSTTIQSNVISGNGANGITAGNSARILGNYIGTDIDGTADLGNDGNGVSVEADAGVTIGAPGAGNVISGNGLNGVFLQFAGDVKIQGNRIGTNVAGTEPLGNDGDGVFIHSPFNILVGGTAPREGNLISANGGNGVEQFGGPGPLLIQGNLIGTDVAGMLGLGNSGDGIHAPGAVTIGGRTNTTPGGPCTGACNLISGNDGDGIGEALGTTIEGNLIGTNITGREAVSNAGNGLVSRGNASVGDGTPEGRNVISGNGGDGLVMEGGLNQVLGTFIGTTADGEQPLGNGGDGVRIIQGSNTIGAPGAGNVISANGGDGVEIANSSFNSVQGNLIGTDLAGTADLGNGGPGVAVTTPGFCCIGGSNKIGGTDLGSGNVIRFNGGDGVSITGSLDNAILGNSIFANAGLGIDLDDDGVTPNDQGDGDGGANFDQNFPVITRVAGTTIEGTLNTIPGTYRIELFRNPGIPACDPAAEGEILLDSFEVTTDGFGDATFTRSLPAPVPGGEAVTATATSRTGAAPNNTSEFSQCPSAIVVKKRTEPAGDTTKFTFTGDASGTIGDGETITVGDLDPGTYASTETVPSGWDLASISCDDDDSTGDIGTATATFRLAAGETVTCTFTDFKRGTIVVKKETDPPGAPGSFTFTGDAAGTIADGGTITVPNVSTVGSPTYRSAESDPAPAFDLSSISCDDGTSAHPSGGDLASRTASFRLDPGETVTCTFTNTQRGTVSVRKTVSGSPISSLLPPEQQSFRFQLRQGASTTSAGTLLEQADANVANGGLIAFASKLVANSPYQLCEIVMPGWRTSLEMRFVLFSPSGDNSTLCTNFSVAPSETKSIMVDNQPPPGGLARTIGFWKNWASCSVSKGNQRPVLDQTLAAADPEGIAIGTLTLHAGDCLKAVRLLDKSTIDTGKKMASDPAFNLAAQLLAAELNVKAGALTCPSAIGAIDDAQALLAAVHFNGVTHDKLSAAQATQANALATTLDRYNNNLLC